MAIDLFGPASAPGAVTSRPSDTRSFGAADTFFADCSSPTMDDGTEFQAAFFNQVLSNWRALARGNGTTGGGAKVVTEDNADDGLLLKAVQQLIQRGQTMFASDVGTDGHVVATYSPAVVEHKLGIRLLVKVATTNTGATDFAPNGLAAVPIKRIGGGALQPGDLVVGGLVLLAFDGTQYQILSLLGPSGGGSAKAPKLIGFRAEQTSPLYVPVALATVCPFQAVSQNNLWGASTYNGTELTVGAGEGGVWNVSAAIHTPQIYGDRYEQIFLTRNGVQVHTGTTATTPSGAGGYVHTATNLSLAPGDKLAVKYYMQAYAPFYTANDTTTNFAAYLISAV